MAKPPKIVGLKGWGERRYEPQVELLRPRYPHMGPYEARLWDTFLKKPPWRIEKVEYDVRVGPGYTPPWLRERLVKIFEKKRLGIPLTRDEELDLSVAESARAITQLRIDVVVHTPEKVYLVEVKPRAGRSALGQLEAYIYWYLRQYKPAKPVRLAIVCRELDRNMAPIFAERGVEVHLVTP